MRKEPKEAENVENTENAKQEKNNIKGEDSNTLSAKEIRDFTSKVKKSSINEENRPLLSLLRDEINDKNIFKIKTFKNKLN